MICKSNNYMADNRCVGQQGQWSDFDRTFLQQKSRFWTLLSRRHLFFTNFCPYSQRTLQRPLKKISFAIVG